MKCKFLLPVFVLFLPQVVSCSASTTLVSSSTATTAVCGDLFTVTATVAKSISNVSFSDAAGSLISNDLAAYHWYIDATGNLTDEFIIKGSDGYYYVISGSDDDGLLGGGDVSSDYADYLLSVTLGDSQSFSTDSEYLPQLRLYTISESLSFAEFSSCAYGYIFRSGYSQCPDDDIYALGEDATMNVTHSAENTYAIVHQTTDTRLWDGDDNIGAFTLSYTTTLQEQSVTATPPTLTRNCDTRVYSCGSGVFATDCTCPDEGFSVTGSEGCEDGGLCSYTQITCESCTITDAAGTTISVSEAEAIGVNERSSYCLSESSTNFGHIDLLE